MQKLIQGCQRFEAEVFESHRELLQKLASSQHPEVLFITCSDSRIDPAMATQTQPGELFIIRNAGNIIPAFGSSTGGEEATVEYAVAALGVEHIIVCGHTHCGAMKGLLDLPSLTKLPSVAQWLKHAEPTRRVVEENYTHLGDDQKLNIAIQENVLMQLENLRTHAAVAAKLAQGKLQLHGWVYKFETGEMFAYHSGEKQFLKLSDTQPQAVHTAAEDRNLQANTL